MPASQILLAVGAGLAGALLFAALLSGSLGALMLSYLVPLPLLAAGLALGVGAVVLAAASASMAMAALGSFALAIIFAIVYAAPAIIMTRQALLHRGKPDGRMEWYPAGGLVLTLAGLAVGAYLLLLLSLSGAEGGLEAQIRAALLQAFKAVAPPDAPADASETLAMTLARYAPGLAAVTWMQMIAINGVLAQWLLSLAKRNLRPSPAMAEIRLPVWLAVAAGILVVGAALSGFADAVAANLLIIALATFLFAGLAVIHHVAGRWDNRRLWLTVIYIVTFAFPWPILLIAGLGVADTLFGFRRRAVTRTPAN
jgi:hypothetical protein